MKDAFDIVLPKVSCLLEPFYFIYVMKKKEFLSKSNALGAPVAKWSVESD